jgi:hypothetical protein
MLRATLTPTINKSVWGRHGSSAGQTLLKRIYECLLDRQFLKLLGFREGM